MTDWDIRQRQLDIHQGMIGSVTLAQGIEFTHGIMYLDGAPIPAPPRVVIHIDGIDIWIHTSQSLTSRQVDTLCDALQDAWGKKGKLEAKKK